MEDEDYDACKPSRCRTWDCGANVYAGHIYCRNCEDKMRKDELARRKKEEG